jgi:hypothetical protein
VILGGANNNDMGFAYAGIFGNSINAVAANTLHVNNFWACDAGGTTNIYLVNLPLVPGIPFSGQLWNNAGFVMVS